MISALISDTSPLRYLVLIEAVELLPRQFSEVIITPAIIGELSQKSTPERVRNWISNSPHWLKVKMPQTKIVVPGLGPGESEAIALAEEFGNCTLLIDDNKARDEATKRGLSSFGTLAIIEAGSRNGWIDFDEYVRRLRLTNFRIHENLILAARSRLAANR